MVTDSDQRALLPAGITDVLPPDAGHEAALLRRVMEVVGAYGYEAIKPPLLEFEETLTEGLGLAVTDQTFRLMDPVSQSMMGVRADMTPQIARIARSRLAGAPRPLRLSYAGQVVRVRGSQLRSERQFTQVGAELIGAPAPAGDAEVICMAAEALSALGVRRLSVDLGMPPLVAAVCRDHGLEDGLPAPLKHALDSKDTASIRGLAGDIGDDLAGLLATMVTAAGPVEETLAVLKSLDLGDEAEAKRAALAAVAGSVAARMPDLSLTLDPVENRGFEYHTGATFTFFARGVRGDLGCGGRYAAARGDGADEPATGFSFFMDSVVRAIPERVAPDRVFVPAGGSAEAARLRGEGWTVIEGLATVDDDAAEARRMQCSHLAGADGILELTQRNGD